MEKKLLIKLDAVIELHEKMSRSYFYSPPATASKRRYYEDANSLETVFEYKGDKILVLQDTQCSCKHVYYTVDYFINGEQVKKDIRFIKKIRKELQALVDKEQSSEERN